MPASAAAVSAKSAMASAVAFAKGHASQAAVAAMALLVTCTATAVSAVALLGAKLSVGVTGFVAEAEVLIPAGTRFEVANTITNAGLTTVILKEIGSGLQMDQATTKV